MKRAFERTKLQKDFPLLSAPGDVEGWVNQDALIFPATETQTVKSASSAPKIGISANIQTQCGLT